MKEGERRERSIYSYDSRGLELGQVYLRAKRKPALNPKWADRISHSILCTPSHYSVAPPLLLGYFVCLCLTRPWLSCQSLCNWPAFTVSGPFPTTSLSSSPFLLFSHSPLRNYYLLLNPSLLHTPPTKLSRLAIWLL